MDKKQIMIILFTIITIISFMSIIIPMTSSMDQHNKINIKESIIKNVIVNGKTTSILTLSENNKTIYMYDNNFTIIKNYEPQPQIINNIQIKNMVSSTYPYQINFHTTSNIIISSIPYLKSFIPYIYKPENNNLFYKVILSNYTNPQIQYNFLDAIGLYKGESAGSSDIIYGCSQNSTFNVQYLPNNFFYFNNSQLNQSLPPHLITQSIHFKFTYQKLYISNVGESGLSYVNNEIIFSNIQGFYLVSFINFENSGNLTITNSSGYSNKISINRFSKFNIPLQNGSYSYSFSFVHNKNLSYINGSFIVRGSQVNINLQIPINTQLSNILFIVFVISNILMIFLLFITMKNYYVLISGQGIMFILGYILNIPYYSFYMISLLIIIISLIVGSEVMKKIGE